jgi:hypothetical protein
MRILFLPRLSQAVQRPHDADPRHHRRPVVLDDQHQGLDGGESLRRVSQKARVRSATGLEEETSLIRKSVAASGV